MVFRLMNRNWLIRVTRALHWKRPFAPTFDATVSWSLRGMRRLLADHDLEIVEVRFHETGRVGRVSQGQQGRRDRPVRRQLRAVGSELLVVVSQLTKYWGAPLALGMIGVARKRPSAPRSTPGVREQVLTTQEGRNYSENHDSRVEHSTGPLRTKSK